VRQTRKRSESCHLIWGISAGRFPSSRNRVPTPGFGSFSGAPRPAIESSAPFAGTRSPARTARVGRRPTASRDARARAVRPRRNRARDPCEKKAESPALRVALPREGSPLEAGGIYGSFLFGIYFLPLLGGYVADNVLGYGKTITIGLIVMFLGYTLLAMPGMGIGMVYAALAVISLGTGFFKGNLQALVGNMYDDPKYAKLRDSAFMIFYMGINIGGLMAPIICGFVGNTGNIADFKWGYFAAGIGMLLSLVIFIPLKNRYVVTPEGKPIGVVPPYRESRNSGRNLIKYSGFFVIVFALFYFIFKSDIIGSFIFATFFTAPLSIILDKSLGKIEKQKIIAMFLLIMFSMVFKQARMMYIFSHQ